MDTLLIALCVLVHDHVHLSAPMDAHVFWPHAGQAAADADPPGNRWLNWTTNAPVMRSLIVHDQ
jgi:hypothetical protein